MARDLRRRRWGAARRTRIRVLECGALVHLYRYSLLCHYRAARFVGASTFPAVALVVSVSQWPEVVAKSMCSVVRVPNYALKGTLRTLREFPDRLSAQGPLTRR